jgi:hypothetical protein
MHKRAGMCNRIQFNLRHVDRYAQDPISVHFVTTSPFDWPNMCRLIAGAPILLAPVFRPVSLCRET